MRSRLLALAALALVVTACGPPIRVRRVNPRAASADLERSVLSSNRPSVFSENLLYRWNLVEVFENDPESALATLRQQMLADPSSRSIVFALAELCFKHARSGKREYYLAAALYAYAFLFPGTTDQHLDELDPRARLAADLYNRGLTEAFKSGDRVALRAGSYTLPFGQQLSTQLDPAELQWANRRLVELIPVAELKMSGLGVRYRRAGIGAPLVADMQRIGPESVDHLARSAKVPVTAFLRIDHPRTQLAEPVIHGSLHIFNAYETRSVEIDGQRVPLELEPSTALAYALSHSRLWELELRGFLVGDLLGQRNIKQPLAFVEPYRRGRIPVVFVHGTASSPARWADMLNVLSNTRTLRDRYQFWFYFYETSNPIAYSALKLRDTLSETVASLDPEGQDPALRQMVVIGHSQGGLLTKMTAIDSGTRLWDAFSRRPLEQLDLKPETKELLRRSQFVTPLPFVREVIFISTPHRGSYVAGWGFSHWVSGFAQLPRKLAGVTAELLQGNSDAFLFDPKKTAFGAVYDMTPGSRFIEALAATPVAPGVGAHSIIPVTGGLPPEGQGDGVVKYDSAHVDGVDSELVVTHQSHSAQSNPLAIEEVRRILFEHAEVVCAHEKVACGPRGPHLP